MLPAVYDVNASIIITISVIFQKLHQEKLATLLATVTREYAYLHRYNQWLKWRGTQRDAVPYLKYMVECVPPRQVSQRTHGDGNGNA